MQQKQCIYLVTVRLMAALSPVTVLRTWRVFGFKVDGAGSIRRSVLRRAVLASVYLLQLTAINSGVVPDQTEYKAQFIYLPS